MASRNQSRTSTVWWPTNPVSTDNLAVADNHIRGIKSAIKATFPNITGAVTATHTVLNYVDGVTSNIQTQFERLIPSGTKMLFQQTSAPTGWTKITTHNDKHCVSSQALPLQAAPTLFNGVRKSSPQLELSAPSQAPQRQPHADHSPNSVSLTLYGPNTRVQVGFDNGTAYAGKTTSGNSGPITYSTQNTGGGQAHNHGFSGTAVSSHSLARLSTCRCPTTSM